MGRALKAGAAAALLGLLLPCAPPAAELPAWQAPGPRERCPVCGMFVARFPDWAAGLVLPDGSRLFFDGARDLVRHLAAAAPGSPVTAAAVFVTDYYRLEPVDGRAAWYVSGSDVPGPMGPELIPFAREEDAREFLRDHRGAGIHRFGELAGLLGESR